MDEVIFLYTTWPDAETAEAAAKAAVQAGLAACAHVTAPVRSIYQWEGVVERASETPAIFKTSSVAAVALRGLILQRHPYDMPAVVAFTADEGASHGDFLDWVRGQTTAVAPRRDQAISMD